MTWGLLAVLQLSIVAVYATAIGHGREWLTRAWGAGRSTAVIVLAAHPSSVGYILAWIPSAMTCALAAMWSVGRVDDGTEANFAMAAIFLMVVLYPLWWWMGYMAARRAREVVWEQRPDVAGRSVRDARRHLRREVGTRAISAPLPAPPQTAPARVLGTPIHGAAVHLVAHDPKRQQPLAKKARIDRLAIRVLVVLGPAFVIVRLVRAFGEPSGDTNIRGLFALFGLAILFALLWARWRAVRKLRRPTKRRAIAAHQEAALQDLVATSRTDIDLDESWGAAIDGAIRASSVRDATCAPGSLIHRRWNVRSGRTWAVGPSTVATALLVMDPSQSASGEPKSHRVAVGQLHVPVAHRFAMIVTPVGWSMDGRSDVAVESVTFNERFVIRSTDAAAAHGLLPPRSMEAMLGLPGLVSLVVTHEAVMVMALTESHDSIEPLLASVAATIGLLAAPRATA